MVLSNDDTKKIAKSYELLTREVYLLVKSSILHKVLDLSKNKVEIKDFTMVPNKILKDKKYNDAEARLLFYYHSHIFENKESSTWNFYDERVLKELGWSEGKLKRTKKSLKVKGDLLVVKSGFDRYDYYIGKDAVNEYNKKKELK